MPATSASSASTGRAPRTTSCCSADRARRTSASARSPAPASTRTASSTRSRPRPTSISRERDRRRALPRHLSPDRHGAVQGGALWLIRLDASGPSLDDVQFRFRDDRPVDHPAVTVDAFLGQTNATAVRIEPGDDARDLLGHLDRLAPGRGQLPEFTATAAAIRPRASCAKPATPANCARWVTCWSIRLGYMRRCGFDSFAPERAGRRGRCSKPRSRATPEVYQADHRRPRADVEAPRMAPALSAPSRPNGRSIGSTPARASRAADAIRSNNMFRGVGHRRADARGAQGRDRWATSRWSPRFGAESAVLLHLAAQVDPNDAGDVPRYRQALPRDARLPRRADRQCSASTNVRILTPDAAELAAKDDNRPALVARIRTGAARSARSTRSAKAMRRLRRLASPGRKAFQASGTRRPCRASRSTRATRGAGSRSIRSPTGRQGRHRGLLRGARPAPPPAGGARAILSIGCAPCTRVVKPGEDPRAGRWGGWDKTECGIHAAIVDGNDPNQPSVLNGAVRHLVRGAATETAPSPAAVRAWAGCPPSRGSRAPYVPDRHSRARPRSRRAASSPGSASRVSRKRNTRR